MNKQIDTPIILGTPEKPLSLDSFIRVCRLEHNVEANEHSLTILNAIREQINKVIDKGEEVVYGLNTGLGSLMRVRLSRDELTTFSRNVVLSHSSGVGEPLTEDVVRGAMLLEANSFLKGHSGVRAVVPLTLIKMLNSGVHPYIPSQGSLGASGDLAPLAHMALVVSRDPNEDNDANSGKAYFGGSLLSGFNAMERAGIPRLVLGPKEGLSIVNGTHITTSILALTLWDVKTLLQSVDIIGAMSLEALRGLNAAYDPKIHKLRNHKGQFECVENINMMIQGSKLINSMPEIVQDPYAFRCTPQVHGASRDVVRYVEETVSTELNSVTDSPLVFTEEGKIQLLSGGNFHAEPLGYAADSLGLAIAGLGTLCERRSYRLTDHALNRGLPSYLIANPGLNNGLMLPQYTAASLASENKVLSHPSSVDSISVAENQEDHVSMATTAARKAASIVNNVARICAIELICAAQALDFRIQEMGDPNILGAGSKTALNAFRNVVTFAERDRVFADDIEKAVEFILSRELIQAVETDMEHSFY